MSELDDYLNEEEPKSDVEVLSATVEKQKVVTLYKLNNNQKPIQWSIKVVPPVQDMPFATIVIETGLVDGKKFEQRLDILEGKNLGKVNATTPYTQALTEAKSKIEQQLRGGYVTDIKNVKKSGTLGSGIPQPLLAHKYHPTGAQKGSKTLEKMKIKGETIHVQPKLDGNRCLIKITPNEDGCSIGMYTRKGDLMPVQLHHITQGIATNYANLFADTEPSEIPELILDGELFSDKLSFNELNGHLKRKDSQDPVQLAKIKYHLYDVMVNEPYSKRYTLLQNFNGHGVEVVPSYKIQATDANIKAKLEEFLAEGHEGLMIRTLATPYENKRSWQLVKVKLFEDEEFEVVDLEQDVMGRLGFVIVKMKEPSQDRDGKLITTFKAGLTGIDHATGKKMFQEKHKYIGKQATVEFFGKSEYGVPRFPKFKGIRD